MLVKKVVLVHFHVIQIATCAYGILVRIGVYSIHVNMHIYIYDFQQLEEDWNHKSTELEEQKLRMQVLQTNKAIVTLTVECR